MAGTLAARLKALSSPLEPKYHEITASRARRSRDWRHCPGQVCLRIGPVRPRAARPRSCLHLQRLGPGLRDYSSAISDQP